MQVYVRVKALGKRKDVLPLKPYELPDGIGSLRELLTAFVESEVERYNSKEPELPLLSCLTVEEIEARSETGKVSFGRLWSDKKADKTKAAQTAIQAFTDGLVRVLMDEAELTELDEPLIVHGGAVFTFVRLTFLAGRMW